MRERFLHETGQPRDERPSRGLQNGEDVSRLTDEEEGCESRGEDSSLHIIPICFYNSIDFDFKTNVFWRFGMLCTR